jgi:thiol-disulfide isomerase/thioredoxin
MKKLILPAAVAVIFATAVVFVLYLKNNKLVVAPEISLSIIDGRKIDLSTLQGKPLLVTFWATTCSTCLKEIPHLVKLYQELGNDNFEIIAIAMPYDPPNLVVALSEKEKIPYPVALDIHGEAVKAFGDVQLTPTSFLIDSQGNIVEESKGEIDIKELRDKVKKLQKKTRTIS